MVLQPAAANDASTAWRMRAPILRSLSAIQGAAAAAASSNCADLHTVAAGMDVHVTGFERGDLGAAGGEEKIARLGLAQAGHRRTRW